MTTRKTGRQLRLRKRELFRSLGYEPHAGQVPVHRSKARRRILACGARWGKSTAAAMEVVAALMTPCSRSLGWVVAPSYDLADRIFLKVVEVVKEHLPHRIVELNLRDHRLVMRNLSGGLSEAKGKSADKPVSLLGEALDWVVVDEAARLKEGVWIGHLAQRLIDRNGWAVLISTPAGTNWFYRLFRRGQKGRDPAYESWQSPSWMNPHLDREVIEQERERLPAETFEQEFEAQFLGDEGDPCDECGFPDPTISGVVAVDHGYQFARCPECEHEVGEDGHTLWYKSPSGEPMLQIIELLHRSPDYVSMPWEEDPDDPVDDDQQPVPAPPGMQRGEAFFGGQGSPAERPDTSD